MIMAIAAIVIIGGGALVFFNGQKKASTTQAVALSVWGVDDKKVFDNLIAYYTQYNPSAKITYTQIDPTNYESDILRAFAEGAGPDVFEIGNHSLPRWQSVLAELPEAYSSQFGTLQMQNDFPSVVQNDFMIRPDPDDAVSMPSHCPLIRLQCSITKRCWIPPGSLFHQRHGTTLKAMSKNYAS